jgi:hypothetical protein
VDFTTLFLRLLIAHAIGDFVLQPAKRIEERRTLHARSPRIYAHGALHGVLASIALGSPWRWREAAVIAAVHVVIEIVDSYRAGHGRRALWFVVDQALHALVIGAIAAHLSGVDVVATVRALATDPSSLAVAAAVVLVTRPAGSFVATFASRWDHELTGRKDNLAGAGQAIGVLERLLIVLFLLTDHFEAVGFLLAAKSIFRFGDLTNPGERKRTEYVLIGTLLSFSIAIAIGMLARAVIAADPG